MRKIITIALFCSAYPACFAQTASPPVLYAGGQLTGPVYYAPPLSITSLGLAYPFERLNDATNCTVAYTGGNAASHVYQARVQTSGTPDTIAWQKDGGSWSSGIPISLASFANSHAYSVGQVVVGSGHSQLVTASVSPYTSQSSGTPSWSTSGGSVVSANVTFRDMGARLCIPLTDGVIIGFGASTGHSATWNPQWANATPYGAGGVVAVSGYIQVVTACSPSCPQSSQASGSPSWNSTLHGTTSDNSGALTWTNEGPTTDGMNNPDSWTFSATISGTSVNTTHNAPGTNTLFTTVQQRLGDTLVSSVYPVDPTGQNDSTAGLNALAAQAALTGNCGVVPSGSYKVTGLTLISACLEAEASGQVFIEGTVANTPVIRMMGYRSKIKGFQVSKSPGLAGVSLVQVYATLTSSQPGVTANTQHTVIEDVLLQGSANDHVAAGLEITADQGAEVQFTWGTRVHIQGADRGWWAHSTAAAFATGHDNNTNNCTDCLIEQSSVCLSIQGSGESVYNNLQTNGCNAFQSVGTVTVSNGSYTVTANAPCSTSPVVSPVFVGIPAGTPIYFPAQTGQNQQAFVASVTDYCHIQLTAPFAGSSDSNAAYGVALAPVVIEPVWTPGGVIESTNNQVQIGGGESAAPLVFIAPAACGNQITTTAVATSYGVTGFNVMDLSGCSHFSLPRFNVCPGVDSLGQPTFAIGYCAVSEIDATRGQWATFQIFPVTGGGAATGGQPDLFRIDGNYKGGYSPVGLNAASLDYNNTGQEWRASTTYTYGEVYVIDAAGHAQQIVSGYYCVSGTTQPTWNDTGGTTTDGTCLAIDRGYGAPTGLGGTYPGGGLYVNTDAKWTDGTIRADTNRTDAPITGSVDFLFQGQDYARIRSQNNSGGNYTDIEFLSLVNVAPAYPSPVSVIARLRGQGGLQLTPATPGCNAGDPYDIWPTAYVAGSPGTASTLQVCLQNEAGTYKMYTLASGAAIPPPVGSPLYVDLPANNTGQSQVIFSYQNATYFGGQIITQYINPASSALSYMELDTESGASTFIPSLILHDGGAQLMPDLSSGGLCRAGIWVPGNPVSTTVGTEGTLNYVQPSGGNPGTIEFCGGNGSGGAAEYGIASLPNLITASATLTLGAATEIDLKIGGSVLTSLTASAFTVGVPSYFQAAIYGAGSSGTPIVDTSNNFVGKEFTSTNSGTNLDFQTQSGFAWNGQGDIGVRSLIVGSGSGVFAVSNTGAITGSHIQSVGTGDSPSFTALSITGTSTTALNVASGGFTANGSSGAVSGTTGYMSGNWTAGNLIATSGVSGASGTFTTLTFTGPPATAGPYIAGSGITIGAGGTNNIAVTTPYPGSTAGTPFTNLLSCTTVTGGVPSGCTILTGPFPYVASIP
jgi:hypothetical protein